MGHPWWLSGKESACQCRRRGVQSLGQEDPLEKEMAAHSSILAWETTPPQLSLYILSFFFQSFCILVLKPSPYKQDIVVLFLFFALTITHFKWSTVILGLSTTLFA